MLGGPHSGDRQAWEALVREYSGLVWAITRAHRLGDADAADVSQATWLRLIEHLGRIDDPARVGAWLATTARRECLRVLRRAQRQVLLGDEEPVHAEAGPSADEAVLRRERSQALWRGFSRLRGSDRWLLGQLLLVEPRPAYEDIARARDMPIGSIGPTRSRALERLRRALGDDGELVLEHSA